MLLKQLTILAKRLKWKFTRHYRKHEYAMDSWNRSALLDQMFEIYCLIKETKNINLDGFDTLSIGVNDTFDWLDTIPEGKSIEEVAMFNCLTTLWEMKYIVDNAYYSRIEEGRDWRCLLTHEEAQIIETKIATIVPILSVMVQGVEFKEIEE